MPRATGARAESDAVVATEHAAYAASLRQRRGFDDAEISDIFVVEHLVSTHDKPPRVHEPCGLREFDRECRQNIRRWRLEHVEEFVDRLPPLATRDCITPAKELKKTLAELNDKNEEWSDDKLRLAE